MRASGTALRTSPRFVELAAAVAGTAMLAAACGTTQAPGRPTGIVPRTHRVLPMDSRAGATAYARGLLASLRLPPGARELPWPARPPAGLTPATPGIGSHMVEPKVLYRLRQPLSANYRFLVTHLPAGTALAGYAQSSLSGVVISQVASFMPTRLPDGIFSAALNIVIMPAHGGGSLLRAAAFVAWYPPRGTARRIKVAGYDAVIIRWHHGARITTTTLTSRQAVVHFVGLYDGLYGMPEVTTRCPLADAGPDSYSYQIVFSPAHGQPRVILTPVCSFVKVSIGGRQVSELYPATALLSAAALAMPHGEG